MENIFRIVACFVILSLFGCASPTGGYLVDKPVILYPQGAFASPNADLRNRSLETLVNAFADNNWEIRRVDRGSSTVEAEACKRRAHCVEVRATVTPEGTIEIRRTPGQELSEKDEVLLQRWIGRLQRSYEKRMEADR